MLVLAAGRVVTIDAIDILPIEIDISVSSHASASSPNFPVCSSHPHFGRYISEAPSPVMLSRHARVVVLVGFLKCASCLDVFQS